MPAWGSAFDDAGPPVRVGRLTVRDSTGDAMAVRGRAIQQLDRMDLLPSAIPPAAILVIRRLLDPTPGRLSLDMHASTTAWAGKVRDQVAALYRAAVRPAIGPVPADSAAVLFVDESELLATYARAVVTGTVADHWWWPVLLGSSTGMDTLVSAMLRSPALVPATVRRLADRGIVEQVVMRLTAAQAMAIVERVCRSFGLPELPARLARPARAARGVAQPMTPSQDGTSPAAGSMPGSGNEAGTAGVQESAPDWLSNGSASAHLRPDPGAPPPFETPQVPWHQHVLVEVALALAESPGRVRDPVFANRVNATWRAAVVTAPAVPRTVRPIHVRSAAGPAPATRWPNRADQAQSPGEQAAVPPSDGSRSERAVAEPSSATRADRASPPRARGEGAAYPGTGTSSPIAEPAEEGAAAAQPWLDGVRTSFGGVAFLVNVMAYLDLPDAFEPDWRLTSQVGAWGVLDLLARGLLDEAPEVARGDPLWSVLAELDGRPGQPPGRRLRSVRHARLPEAWLGHVLGDPAPAPSTLVRGALVRDLSPPAVAWLELVVPSVRMRLVRALGTGRAARREVRALLRRRAHFHVTATHVDVVMRLADVSLAARRAGLDRDPGWDPSFGRVIKIHFE